MHFSFCAPPAPPIILLLLLQGSAERWFPGLVNFVPAVAYHSCLAVLAAFTQPGARLLAWPCKIAFLQPNLITDFSQGFKRYPVLPHSATEGRTVWHFANCPASKIASVSAASLDWMEGGIHPPSAELGLGLFARSNELEGPFYASPDGQALSSYFGF